MDKLDELMECLLNQAKKLADNSLEQEKLDQEIDRGRSMALLASQYISAEQTKLRREMISKAKGVGIRDLKYLEANS